MEPSDATDAATGEALLALNHDKSGNGVSNPENQRPGCPNPRLDRAFVVHTGEVLPIPCGRNGCPVCRRRNVQVTAAKMGLNQTLSDRPMTYAVLSTTRDHWLDAPTLREGWAQFARRVRREVNAECSYAWFREWTEGRNDGIRRTHYHSVWSLNDDDEAQRVAAISNDVWGRVAGAWSDKAHGWKRVYDAGGLARYVAGLVGHHLKANQAPPPGWTGRRFGTAKGFYAIDSRELDKAAKAMVRDDRLAFHLERVMLDELNIPDGLPLEIWDELLTDRLERAKQLPPPRVVSIAPGFWA